MKRKENCEVKDKNYFVASSPKNYFREDKSSLSLEEQLEWKKYEIWKATQAIERRESVQKALMRTVSHREHGLYHTLGTPYPIIEDYPRPVDCIKCVRWYEHVFAICTGPMYMKFLRLNPLTRFFDYYNWVMRLQWVLPVFIAEIAFAQIGEYRLLGEWQNENECYKYGVMEDAERLKQKRDNWEKYAAHREEWMKRYDYHVWGMRPGSRGTLMSPCWLPPSRVRYNTKLDYPMRKHPTMLTSLPARVGMAAAVGYRITRPEACPNFKDRPELAYTTTDYRL